MIIYYFAITQKYSKIVFEYESLAIFAGNTQKYSCSLPLINSIGLYNTYTIYTDAICKKGKSDELFTQGSILIYYLFTSR